jgi:cytidyltransferase-like protein
METQNQIVMVFGTFDHLHAGHENMFAQARAIAKKLTNPLIVAIVARDKTVKQIKGRSPDNDEKSRVQTLAETGWADMTLIGDKKDKYIHIKKYRPAIIALGYDQFAFTLQLEKLIIDLNLDAKIVRLTPYRPDIYKSSLIKEKNDQTPIIPTSTESFKIEHIEPVQK